jgi:hypothetical protein
MNITVELEGELLPLTAPAYAAAFMLSYTPGADKADVVFRTKRTAEASGLVALKAARTEVPGFQWTAVSAMPQHQTSGGTPVTESPYYLFSFRREKGAWYLQGTDDSYAAAIQRMTAVSSLSVVGAASGMRGSIEDIVRTISGEKPLQAAA